VAALTDDDQRLLRRMRARLDRDVRGYKEDGVRRQGFKELRAYKRGRQRLKQLGIAVPEELREFVTIVAWPGTYSDAVVSRLRPQGFTTSGELNKDLWKWWQANDLDTEIRMGLSDMFDYGRGYLCAGRRQSNEDLPLLTVESPFQMTHEWSNRDRLVTDAVRFYSDEVDGKTISRATMYRPNENRWLLRHNGKWIDDPDLETDEHGTGRVMVHPLVNRPSSDDRYGESELLPIIGLTDASARALTNAQVATEVAALPQRWAAGMSAADFKDPKTGEQLTAWEAYFGSVWVAAKENAKFGQFSAADLANFKTIWSTYAQAAAGLTGLPMRYLGQMSDNPPSADGIRADEARLVGTAEDKQILADGPIERFMRDAHFLATGDDDLDLSELEVSWRNAATPSPAQAADRAVKLYGERIISLRQTRRDLGYTEPQIVKMEEEDAAERETRSDPTLERISRGLIDAAAGSDN
jgi:hypothetical protein